MGVNMNVTLTTEEAFVIYELLRDKASVSTPSESHMFRMISEKFRTLILESLQESQEKTNSDLFAAWTESEKKKINDLHQANKEIKIDTNLVKKFIDSSHGVSRT